MVSEEFKQNVGSGDVMTVRSALADYLIIDRTFQKFDEAVMYAEQFMKVLESDDGQYDYDEDPNNWNEDYLIDQKGFLLMNFSQKRIDHFKKVIHKVWGTEDKYFDTSKMCAESKVKVQENKAERTVLSEKRIERKDEKNPKYPKKTRDTRNSEENPTGKKTIKEERGDVKRIEEEIHPIDIAAWMIGGGIAMGVIGGIVYGIGSAVAEPVMIHTGLTVAKVGGGVTIAGGVIKIVKK